MYGTFPYGAGYFGAGNTQASSGGGAGEGYEPTTVGVMTTQRTNLFHGFIGRLIEALQRPVRIPATEDV